MSTSSPRPPAPLWQRLLLMAVSPVVFLALAEGAVRVSGIDTDLARNENFEIAVPVWLLADPDWVQIQHERLQRPAGVKASDVAWLRNFEEARYIQYRLKRNIDVAAVNPFNELEVARGITFRLTSNSRGFRGPEVSPRTASTPPLRIVTFGDSSTFGWGVDREWTFQELLVDRFRQRGRPVEVINMGMPGFTSRHGLAVQEHYAHDLHPDVVVISFGANDGRFGLQAADEALRADETRLAGVAWTLKRLEVYKLMRRVIFSVYDPFSAMDSDRTGATPPSLVQSVPPERFRRNVMRLAGLARQQGAESVFLSVCAPDEHREVMHELSASRQIPMVDAVELFRDRVDELRDHRLYPDEVAHYERLYGLDAMRENWRYYVTTDGCHPNRAGHSLIADRMVEAVEQVLAARQPPS